MVTNVSTYDAGAYLSQIKGTAKPTPTPAPAPAPTPAPTQAPTPAPTSSGNGVSLSPDLIALLQGSSSASGNAGQIYDLLGGSSSNLGGGYDALLQNASKNAPLEQAISSAQQQKTQTAAKNSNIQSALSGYHKGFSAYNKVLQQNAQAVLDASKKGQLS